MGLRLDISLPIPNLSCTPERTPPPTSALLDMWAVGIGLVKAKGGKHSAHSFSCFDLECSYSKGQGLEEKIWG